MTNPVMYTRAQLSQTRAVRTVKRAGVADELILNADIDLFNVSGPVLVTSIFGIVKTVLAGAGIIQFHFADADGLAAGNISAVALSLAATPVNGIISWDGLIAGVPAAGAVAGVLATNEKTWNGPMTLSEGVISITTITAAITGLIDFYVTYIPLDAETVITAL